MSSFNVLSGRQLSRAIKGFGAKVASFSQLTHQLGYSALVHVEEHRCASHLNALFAATPANYRAALRSWSCALGKVTFDPKPEDGASFFVYAKGKKSDLPAALATSPADFERAASAKGSKSFDEIAAFEAFAKRLEEKGGSARAIELANAAVRALKTPVQPAKAPVLAVSNAPLLELAA